MIGAFFEVARPLPHYLLASQMLKVRLHALMLQLSLPAQLVEPYLELAPGDGSLFVARNFLDKQKYVAVFYECLGAGPYLLVYVPRVLFNVSVVDLCRTMLLQMPVNNQLCLMLHDFKVAEA